MKALFKGKIKSMTRGTGNEKPQDMIDRVHIKCDLIGNVLDSKVPDAKQVLAEITFTLKPIVADGLKFGQEISVLISDSEIFHNSDGKL